MINSQSACLSRCHAISEAQDQTAVTTRQLQVCSCGGVLSDDRKGLSFTTAAGPHQCSHIYRSENQQYTSFIFKILHVGILQLAVKNLVPYG
jgi:hypothetical protein